MKICIIEKCNSVTRGGKYCHKHYMRIYRYGDPYYIGRVNKNRPKICTIDGCGLPHSSQGYCNKHACRFRFCGDPTKPLLKNRNHKTICSIQGCNRKWFSNNLCQFHYNNQPIMRQKERLRAKKYAKNHPEVGLACSLRSLKKTFELLNNDYCILKTIWEFNRALKQWADSIRKQDNYTCQVCGIQNVKLFAHHLLYKAKYPKLSLNLSNGITLCKKCHNEVHGRRLVN